MGNAIVSVSHDSCLAVQYRWLAGTWITVWLHRLFLMVFEDGAGGNFPASAAADMVLLAVREP